MTGSAGRAGINTSGESVLIVNLKDRHRVMLFVTRLLSRSWNKQIVWYIDRNIPEPFLILGIPEL